MPKYSESVLEQIKARLTVSEVVSQYIRLTRKGERFWGLCPFHHEKTPSFTVVDDQGFYKCFGCGKGGSMFDFIMEIEHVTFPQAVELLAKKAGIELKEETPQEKEKASKQKTLSELYNKIATSFHYYLLNQKDAAEARSYIQGRNISSETCEKFLLGFATDNPQWLYNFLKKNNYSDELLKESGLFSKDKVTFPFFKNRVLFPIRNWQGNVVGFSGRTLLKDDKVAKYKNSSESQIYSKRNNLFGLYESLPEMKKREEIILCEGNFDVISLHQAGLSYACAPLGTAFTDEQAKLIKRYCKKVTLLFDTDSAGQNATKKALVICQQNDLENCVIQFEGAKDASQMLSEQGPEALQNACSNTIIGFSYLVHLAQKMYDLDLPKGKTSLFKEVKPYLDATSSVIERQGYIKYLSETLQVSEEFVLSEYKKVQSTEVEEEVKTETVNSKYKLLKSSPDLNAMLLIINNKTEFDYFRSQVKINFLEDRAAQALYTVLEDAERQNIRTGDMLLQMIEDKELRDFVVTSFTEDLYRPTNIRASIDDAIYRIRLNRLEEKRKNIQSLINTSSMESMKDDEFLRMLEMKSSLDREIEELKVNSSEE